MIAVTFTTLRMVSLYLFVFVLAMGELFALLGIHLLFGWERSHCLTGFYVLGVV